MIKIRKNETKRKKVHPTNSDVLRIEKDIRTLRDSNKTDAEIRALLGLELRTYQNYLKRIHDEDKEIWHSIASEQIESELLRLKDSLEQTYQKAKELYRRAFEKTGRYRI